MLFGSGDDFKLLFNKPFRRVFWKCGKGDSPHFHIFLVYSKLILIFALVEPIKAFEICLN